MKLFLSQLFNTTDYRITNDKIITAWVDFKRTPKQYIVNVSGFQHNNHFTNKEKKEIKTLITDHIENNFNLDYIGDRKIIFRIY